MCPFLFQFEMLVSDYMTENQIYDFPTSPNTMHSRVMHSISVEFQEYHTNVQNENDYLFLSILYYSLHAVKYHFALHAFT